MKKLIAALAFTLAPMTSMAAISYEGVLGDGVAQAGSLASESGWAQSDGSNVDFWSFTGNAGETVSLFASSTATDVALSLFFGTPDALSQATWFSSDSDWDLFELVTLSASAGNESLLNLMLPYTGMFTVVIGGEVPDFLANDDLAPFDYTVALARQAAAVPLPASMWLMLPGLAGLIAASRRTA